MRPKVSGGYLIVAGERRWRACRMAGLTEAPVVVKDVTDEQAMEIALVENLQREDLDPVEEAMGIRELMTRCDLTQEQAARKLGKSRSALANSLRLLNLPENVLELLKSGFLNTGHAKVILGLPTPELQEQAAQMIADHELNVRQAEVLCKKLARPAKGPAEPAPHRHVAGGGGGEPERGAGQRSQRRIPWRQGQADGAFLFGRTAPGLCKSAGPVSTIMRLRAGSRL